MAFRDLRFCSLNACLKHSRWDSRRPWSNRVNRLDCSKRLGQEFSVSVQLARRKKHNNLSQTFWVLRHGPFGVQCGSPERAFGPKEFPTKKTQVALVVPFRVDELHLGGRQKRFVHELPCFREAGGSGGSSLDEPPSLYGGNMSENQLYNMRKLLLFAVFLHAWAEAPL